MVICLSFSWQINRLKGFFLTTSFDMNRNVNISKAIIFPILEDMSTAFSLEMVCSKGSSCTSLGVKGGEVLKSKQRLWEICYHLLIYTKEETLRFHRRFRLLMFDSSPSNVMTTSLIHSSCSTQILKFFPSLSTFQIDFSLKSKRNSWGAEIFKQSTTMKNLQLHIEKIPVNS